MDWKLHKKLCSYLATAAEEVCADTFFGQQVEFGDDHDEGEGDVNAKVKSWKSWTQFRVNASRMCEILIGRCLEQWEKEVFLFPRACRVCRLARKDGMIDCLACMGVTYCSLQHKEEHQDDHRGSGMCQELKYAMVCDNYESTVSVAAPPLPPALDTKFHNLEASDMPGHLEWSQKKGGSTEVDLEEMEFRFLSDRLSGPLTIVYAVGKYGLSRQIETYHELTVHVVGSNVIEMLGIIKWEYLGHRLPGVGRLRFVFVGLELDGEEVDGESAELSECDTCRDRGTTVRYEMRRMTYKEYADSMHYLVPDVVVAFNCGFHEFESEPEKETWKDSLPYLTRHPGTPLLFTSYTKTEAAKDMALIEATSNNLKVEACCEANPFRSHRPVRDFEYDSDKDVFYSNQYLSVVKKKIE